MMSAAVGSRLLILTSACGCRNALNRGIMCTRTLPSILVNSDHHRSSPSIRGFSTTQSKWKKKKKPVPWKVWPDDWVDAVPDRDFYHQNPPNEGDMMYITNVKAAPARHYYSTFHDPVIDKFEKMILKKGKGALAYQLMAETLAKIKLVQVGKYHRASDEEKPEIETDPVVIFNQALINAMPVLSVKQATKAGAKFKIPFPLSEKQKFFMASKWMLNHCRSGKPDTPLSERLSKEVLAAYNNGGVAVKKKQELHREVEANRAYAHVRWS